MQTYILKRVLLMIPMLIGISFVSFGMMQLAPGAAGTGAAGEGQSTKITKQQRDVMERAFHLDQPIYKRYFFWLGLLQNEPTEEELKRAERVALNRILFHEDEGPREPTEKEIAENPISDSTKRSLIPKQGLLYGDFGMSMQIHSKTVWQLLAGAIPVTLLFNSLTLLMIYLFAVPMGIFSATHQGSRRDKAGTLGLFMLYSMPNFWVGALVLRAVVALPRAWQLPIQGIQPDNADQLTMLEWLWASSKYFILPLAVMSYAQFAGMSRYMRSGMIDTIRADYIRTARAKGLKEFIVVYKHALRNSLIPIITLLGSELPALFSGSLIVEYIFGIPGMGKLAYEALLTRDYTVLMAELTIVAVMVMLGFMLSDILYCVADPRISFEGK